MGSGSKSGDELLKDIVAGQMPGADVANTAVVVAMTGLLARVAYADRDYDDAEKLRIRSELEQVLGFSEQDIDVICMALDGHIKTIGQGPTAKYSNTLRMRFDDPMRAETVRTLLELAAADRVVTDAELALIRQVAEELGVPEVVVHTLVDEVAR